MRLRFGLELAYLGFFGVLGLLHAANYPNFYRDAKPLLFDARAYWLAGQADWVPYALPPGAVNAYLYSPAFSQVLEVVTWLPWRWFAVLWLTLELAAFVWLLWPMGWAWGVVLLLWCVPELYIGNIYGFLGVATVLALTGRPQFWALGAVTKPVLFVGAGWHLVRGEWRYFSVAMATTTTVVLVSFALQPALWRAWIDFLVEAAGASSPAYAWRVAAGLALVVLAGLINRKWLVPMALVAVLPVIGGISPFSLLAAIPRLSLPAGTRRGVPRRIRSQAAAGID